MNGPPSAPCGKEARSIDSYQLLKSVHLICVVSWFAGMFYIFRLFVYHIKHWAQSEVREVLAIMERKLLKYIVAPAAAASLASGGALLFANPGLLDQRWLWLKFLFVSMLLAYCYLAFWVHLRLDRGELAISEKSCRLINEVPTLALIGISLLVFLKPGFGQ